VRRSQSRNVHRTRCRPGRPRSRCCFPLPARGDYGFGSPGILIPRIAASQSKTAQRSPTRAARCARSSHSNRRSVSPRSAPPTPSQPVSNRSTPGASVHRSSDDNDPDRGKPGAAVHSRAMTLGGLGDRVFSTPWHLITCVCWRARYGRRDRTDPDHRPRCARRCRRSFGLGRVQGACLLLVAQDARLIRCAPEDDWWLPGVTIKVAARVTA
jgi:hypothetical protein